MGKEIMTIDELIDKLERLKHTQIGITGATQVLVCCDADELDIDSVYDTKADNGYRYCLIGAVRDQPDVTTRA